MSRLPRVLKLLAGCMTTVLLLVTVACIVLLFTQCSFNKYVVAAGLPNPDIAYQTGTVAGYNVYIWECYQGKRIVLYNTTSEMTSGPFKREEASCGGTAAMELVLAKERRNDLDPRRFW